MMCAIETDRLQLRMFSPTDLNELALIFSDPDVVRHLGTGKPATLEETGMALHSIMQHWKKYGYGRWAVTFKPTQKLIGYCGLRNFDGTPELVYLLSKPYWGMGLATEMAKTSLQYGFEEMNFDRIVAMTKLANIASRRVMEKLSMRYERNTVIYDMEVVFYALTRAEFISGRGIGCTAQPVSRRSEESDGHHQFPTSPAPPLLSSPANEAKMVSR